jgi:hypothetical protein
MLNKDMECLDKDKRLFSEVREILLVLTSAEKQGQNLDSPLKQVETIVNDVDDEILLNVYPRLLNGLQTAITNEQTWADDYFTFILRLCEMLNETRAKANQGAPTDNVTIPFIPA